jgi:hypothetical protein
MSTCVIYNIILLRDFPSVDKMRNPKIHLHTWKPERLRAYST